MHTLLRKELNIEDDIARQLIGESRTGKLIEHLNFIHDRNKKNTIGTKRIKNALDKCAYIIRVRAIVAHKPFNEDDDAYNFYNEPMARRKESAYVYRCTIRQLENCTKFALREGVVLLATGLLPESEPTSYDALPYQAWIEKLDLPFDPPTYIQKTSGAKRPPRL